jgi:hypothetical protein
MEEQQIKLVLLRERNEYLIGSITELDEEPSLLIEKCMEVLEDGTLRQFPLHAQQRDLFLTSECVLTILDPNPQLLEKYEQE